MPFNLSHFKQLKLDMRMA